MRDLLCPPSELLSPDSSKSDDQVLVEDQCLDGEVVSGVGEPAAYLQLAGQLLAWLAARLATTEESGWLASYNRANLGESMVVSLAGLVKEVDTEMTNNNLPAQLQVVHGKVMSRANLESVLLQPLWTEFSDSLSSLTHNLVAGGSAWLTDQLSSLLLVGLGLDPAADTATPWPLYVRPRSLAVLAQVLLVRQRQESDNYSVKTTTQVQYYRGKYMY